MRDRSFLAIDVETTGLDPATHKIIEVGWGLFDIPRKSLILSGGCYVNRINDDDPPGSRVNLSEEIRGITRIQDSWIRDNGMSESQAFGELRAVIGRAGPEAMVAHNAPFDKAFLANAGFTSDKTWVCTQRDLPGNVGDKALRYLALDRSVLSFYPHRAAYDAVQCGAVLATFDFDVVLARAQSPTVVLVADVTFKENQKAKDLGFKWERPFRHSEQKIPKSWVKAVKELELADVRRAAGVAGVVTHVFTGELS